MSGIYIRGMEMPKNCFLCKLSYLAGERLYCNVTYEEVLRAKIAQECPLISVPDHHDLIDKNDLKLALMNIKYEDNARKDLAAVFREVNLAKTIIPAEEAET